MKKLFLLLLLITALPAFSQVGQRWNTALVASGGNNAKIVPHAAIYVCAYSATNICDTPTGIYSDAALNVPISQPLIAATSGVYYYFAGAGTTYTEKMCISASQCVAYPVYINGGGGGGTAIYPPAGIPLSTGSSWGTSYHAQGTDTNLLTSGTISGLASLLCTDANGGATTVGCPSVSPTSGITALTGDGTATGPGSSVLTLSTVNSGPGLCGDSTHVCQFTVNAKGLVTGQTGVVITAGSGNVTATSFSTNVLPKASGLLSLVDSSILDNGTTVSTSDTGGWVGPGYTSNGTGAFYLGGDEGTKPSVSVFTCGTGADWGWMDSTKHTPAWCLNSSTTTYTVTALGTATAGHVAVFDTNGIAIVDGGAAGSSAFSGITSGTNTTAAMLVGSGASFGPTGTGTIQATNIASTIAAGSNVTITGSGTVASPYSIAAAATSSLAFSALTGSTNTTAAMLVGSGASFGPTGTGTIQATNIASTIAAGTNVTITGSGTVSSPYSISASATSSLAFSAITGSTNSTAAMVIGTGASLDVSGSGTINATKIGGITVTGTPSVGMTPIATSSSAAAWAYPPITIGFVMNSGATGTGVGPILIAARNGTFTKCKVVTKASDGATALTFTIKQNGVAVFSSSNTVAAGTSSGTLSTFTNLTSSPLTVTADDLFTIDISSGTSSWIFTAQLE